MEEDPKGKVNKVLEVLRDEQVKNHPTNQIFNGFQPYLERGDLTEAEVIIIKWRYGYFGGFYQALLDLYNKADDGNRTRLAGAFPEVGNAMVFYHKPAWWDDCERKAEQLGLSQR